MWLRVIWYKFCVLIVFVLLFSDCKEVQLFTQKKHKAVIDVPKTRMVKGVEFSDIARGPLLKLLTAYEEQLNNRLAGKNVKPIFTVQFANNEHTKKFIYPDVRKKVLPSDIRS